MAFLVSVRRGMGYYTGRAVGWLNVMRGEFLGNSPLWQLQEELSKSVLQLQAVKSDVRGLSAPATRFGQQVGAAPPSDPPGRTAYPHAEGWVPPTAGQAPPIEGSLAGKGPGTGLLRPHEAASGVAVDDSTCSPAHTSGSGGRNAAGAGPVESRAGEGAGGGAGGRDQPVKWGHFGIDESIRPAIFVDVSAGDIERARNLTNGRKCGSDILADALEEAEVASLAGEFFRGRGAKQGPS